MAAPYLVWIVSIGLMSYVITGAEGTCSEDDDCTVGFDCCNQDHPNWDVDKTDETLCCTPQGYGKNRECCSANECCNLDLRVKYGSSRDVLIYAAVAGLIIAVGALIAIGYALITQT